MSPLSKDLFWGNVLTIETEELSQGFSFYVPRDPKKTPLCIKKGKVVPASESSLYSSEEEKVYIIPCFFVEIKPRQVARDLDFRLSPEVRAKVEKGNYDILTLIQDPLIQKAQLALRTQVMSKVTLLVNHRCTYVKIMYRQTFTALVKGGDGPDKHDFGLAYVEAGFVGE